MVQLLQQAAGGSALLPVTLHASTSMPWPARARIQPMRYRCTAAGLRTMTNECVIANQGQEHGQSPEEDELALLRHQQALRRQLRGGGPVVFTFSSSHGPQIFHGRHRTALA